MSGPIKVLVVDDSAFMRKMVTDIVSRDSALVVVGQARDGNDALAKLPTLNPDVITLDVEMPNRDGYSTLVQIMATRPIPVIMLSSLTQTGADMTMKCLAAGAVDFVGKPSGAISLDIENVEKELIAKIKAAVTSKLRVSAPRPIPLPVAVAHPVPISFPSVGRGAKSAILVIGSSTGGPRALQNFVPYLPADLGVPVVIIQHMPAGFTASLAARLNSDSPLTIREAKVGDTLKPGLVLIAPGGQHLIFDSNGVATLTSEPPVHGVRPSVDVTLSSLAPLYGSQTVAVLLTGMGRDGARALKAIRDLGGETLAEDESTCVVFGMPKAAADIGGVCQMLPLPSLPAAAVHAIRQRQGVPASVA
jgi:two-component system chemotaxis response regulator CheB